MKSVNFRPCAVDNTTTRSLLPTVPRETSFDSAASGIALGVEAVAGLCGFGAGGAGLRVSLLLDGQALARCGEGGLRAGGGGERPIAFGSGLLLFGAHAGGALIEGFALGALAFERAADIALLAQVLHADLLALV